MNKKDKIKDLKNEVPTKTRFPRENEFIGIVEKRLGSSRMHIRKQDGNMTLARIPGRLRKFLWIREGDIVLLKPWELEKDKCDLLYKYKPNELNILKRKGITVDFEIVEEF